MPLQTHKKKIGTLEYTIINLPAWEGFAMQQTLARICGGRFAEFASVVAATESPPVGIVVSAFAEIFGNPEFLEISRRLLAGSFVGKEPLEPKIDDHFAGNYLEMIQLIWFALVSNFGNFTGIGSVSDWLQSARAKVAAPSTLPKASTSGSPSSSAGARG